jgi:adenylylsulfate kinase-like enzyme
MGMAGAGKTTIAEAMERIVPDSFIIDGDDLRAETSNTDLGLDGREKNMNLGLSRAR